MIVATAKTAGGLSPKWVISPSAAGKSTSLPMPLPQNMDVRTIRARNPNQVVAVMDVIKLCIVYPLSKCGGVCLLLCDWQ